MFSEDNTGDDSTLRSKSNPFQDVPHDKKASLVKQGLLQRKLHADIDGKRSESHTMTNRLCVCQLYLVLPFKNYLKAESVIKLI